MYVATTYMYKQRDEYENMSCGRVQQGLETTNFTDVIG